jgi:alpha-L-glutamate ligase-like protein
MFFFNTEKILGMNARNLLYIREHNSRAAIRLADDKLASKKLLKKNKIPVMPMLALFDSFQDIEEFDFEQLPSSFVLKPNKGFGGEGIWVIKNKARGGWRRTDGSIVNVEMMKDHLYNIFDGNYSLGNVEDVAYIEERVKNHNCFKKLTYGGGLPDIRVIVYNMIPVMAMLRLPTRESGGKANLHQGGIGVGVEIASGVTTKAIWHDNEIKRYPETNLKLHGIRVPFWKEILEMSATCQQISGLGYIGVDIVLDAKRGPLVLELNARPGLGIQNANKVGLRSRLRRVEGLKLKNPVKAVRIARELFGGELSIEIEKEYDKPVVHSKEEIVLMGKRNKKVRLVAKVDTGAYRTSIDHSVAEKLNLGKPIGKKIVKSALGQEERDIYEVTMILSRKKVKTEVFLSDRAHMKYDAIIGRRDLKNFLVDPSIMKVKK